MRVLSIGINESRKVRAVKFIETLVSQHKDLKVYVSSYCKRAEVRDEDRRYVVILHFYGENSSVSIFNLWGF